MQKSSLFLNNPANLCYLAHIHYDIAVKIISHQAYYTYSILSNIIRYLNKTQLDFIAFNQSDLSIQEYTTLSKQHETTTQLF